MVDENQTPEAQTVENETGRDTEAQPEGAIEGDPNIGEAGVDKVMLRVEGQNQNIKTPPPEIQADIAATAADVEDLIMGIEDEA